MRTGSTDLLAGWPWAWADAWAWAWAEETLVQTPAREDGSYSPQSLLLRHQVGDGDYNDDHFGSEEASEMVPATVLVVAFAGV